MQSKKIIPYARQSISEQDIEAVVEVLRSDRLTQGPGIAGFEEAFAAYIGAKYAVAVSSGTAALHLSAIALGVMPCDKVITTPITFAASANCVRYCGGEPIFSDIDPDSYLLDINKVRKLLASHPKGTFKGIIPVDFAGYPVNLEEFRSLADEYGLWIIEDACHAPGGHFLDSSRHKQMCGNGVFSDLAIFSFHPVKHITTGEGGMITTNNEELYKKLIQLRTHGITKDSSLLTENHGGWYYEMQDLGYNYRLTDLQAALGISQLSKADESLLKRREIAERYNKAFYGSGIKCPDIKNGYFHAWHLYVIQVKNRPGLYNHLLANDIFSQVHYIPVHLQPYYRKLGWKNGDLPVAELYYDRCLSLPMYPSLSKNEQDFVINTVLEFIHKDFN